MKERLYKNWYIIDGGLGYKLYPRDFYLDKDLKRWYDNGFSCEFTSLKSAKEYISSTGLLYSSHIIITFLITFNILINLHSLLFIILKFFNSKY